MNITKKVCLLLAILIAYFLVSFLCIPNGVVAGATQDFKIHFYYQNSHWTYDTSHFESDSFYYQYQGQKYGRFGSGEDRARLLNKVRRLGFGARESLEYCFVGLGDTLKNIQDCIDCEAKDATISFDSTKSVPFNFREEKVGFKVDFDQILEDLAESIKKSNEVKIMIKPQVIEPDVVLDDIKHYANLRGSFYTSFNGENANRKNNIRLSAKCFDGLVLERGQEFSFNKITGRRSQQNGYLPANIIVDKKYIEGYGGGVCQVSTTLYNALLLSGIEILEVHSHSLASGYVNMGFDAMVNYGTSDLRWVNNTDTRLYIQSQVTDNQVSFKIWGNKEPNKPDFRRVTEIEKTYSPKADEVIIDTQGEYSDLVVFEDEEKYKTLPKKGYRVRAILEKYEGEKLVERKLLRRVTYQPTQGVKVVGAKKRPTQNKENNLDKNIVYFWQNLF